MKPKELAVATGTKVAVHGVAAGTVSARVTHCAEGVLTVTLFQPPSVDVGEVIVVAPVAEGYVRFPARARHVGDSDRSLELVVSGDPEVEQRRQHARVPIVVPASVAVLRHPDEAFVVQAAATVDVSEGGVFLRTSPLPASDAIIHVALHFKGKTVQAVTRVISIEPPSILHASFLWMPEDHADFLRELVGDDSDDEGSPRS